MGKDVGNNQITETTIEPSAGTKGRIQYIPYWRLCPSPLNVRQKPPTGIESLAETIDAQGVLQNLVVHELKGRTKLPKLGVCAGKRRKAALDLLFSQSRITKDEPVPVLIVSEGEALAASLIENREREEMHIADECVAFRLLVDEGKSVAHIAAMFKVSDLAVRRKSACGPRRSTDGSAGRPSCAPRLPRQKSMRARARLRSSLGWMLTSRRADITPSRTL